MGNLLKFISENAPVIILTLGALVLAMTVLVSRMAIANARLTKQWRSLLTGSNSQNLESVLGQQLSENARLLGRLDVQARQISELEFKMESAKRFVGLVRYDAFEDVGGSQSFALAIYDDQGNGAVVNSMVSRTDCRVYCKPLVSGRSDRELTREEARAVDAAASAKPRAVISV